MVIINHQPSEKRLPMRKTFESEIQQLKDEVLVLGSMVEQAILGSVEALKKRDVEASRLIYEADARINAKRYAIEEQVMIAIATQQPMAHDLRLLASLLEVSGELERMGDYAKGIAKINILMGDQPLLKPLIDIPRMAQKGADMLHRALTAFVNEDAETARLIPYEDDEVDNLYDQIYHELMLFVIQDARSIERANWLLWVAHNLERLADRVTNICERTVFIATGEMKEIESSRDE
ncbi:MAG: phosphate transport system regulatory protein PhoU [Chloroflexi bacterium GWB2_49_20]|nr:MAG: phosphate transport system regulatory protein PhoU [Chloroflexi bacterium GWB2_49_20]OGN78763.1 MAG: phosphate transport system regulatory protein PhoU [Chloroflexi bacterium GWC2_49_37]OGN85867.1 MAG: phosphate transport system regulatory protein PhoU [Chloroflexi bacterium GWD2_49_16]